MSIKLQLGSLEHQDEEIKLQYIPARIEESHEIDLEKNFHNYTKEKDGCE